MTLTFLTAGTYAITFPIRPKACSNCRRDTNEPSAIVDQHGLRAYCPRCRPR